MKKFSNIRRLVLCVSVLAIALSVPTSRAADGPPTQNINVVNTRAIQIRDVDNPARQPFHIALNADLPVGRSQTSCPTTLFTVPSGKVLVVEYVSLWGVSQVVQSPIIDISRTGVQTEYLFFLEHKGTSQIGDPLYGANQQTRLYFAPGEDVTYCVARDVNTDDLGYRIRLSGYLVNLE